VFEDTQRGTPHGKGDVAGVSGVAETDIVPGFTSFDQNVLNWPRPVILRSLEDYV
jgi:hypothetical protein